VRVIVIGAGIVGLSIAWRAAQAGLDVTLVDPTPGDGASRAAAGMLAPVSELHAGEEPLLALNAASHARWPDFADELGASSDVLVPLRRDGTLVVAFDDDDMRAVDEVFALQSRLGLDASRRGGRDCRRLEPLLSPRVRGGVHVADEANVDGRTVCRALLVAVERSGGRLVREQVDEVLVAGDRVTGVRLVSGPAIPAERVVLAAGAWAGSALGLPANVTPPVRPVKGQILRLRFDPERPMVSHNVRATVRGRSVYLVPRAGGELVVGATVEEQGFDTSVTAGGVHGLLDAAIDVVPAVGELELVEAIARLRPATPDNAPVIGTTDLDGLILASGHHRNGVLLAPVTADAVATILAGHAPPAEVAPFDPRRFDRDPGRER
jgi:glycine oxidase